MVALSSTAAARKFRDDLSAEQKPDCQNGIDASGYEQHRPRAGQPEGRGLARR